MEDAVNIVISQCEMRTENSEYDDENHLYIV